MHNARTNAPESWSPVFTISARAVLARINASRILPDVLVRPGRSQAIAAIVAHAGAGQSLRTLALIADAGLVLFAIDDLLDEPGLDHAEKSLRIAQLSDVARGDACPEVSFDPIARAIATLRTQLAALASDTALVDVWSDAMVRMLAGMGAELADAPAPPDLGTYLQSARDSIGVEMIALVAFIAMDPAGTRASLTALRRAERHCSAAVRIANDLRTCERERREGRVNALAFVGEVGRADLEALCEESLRDARHALTRGDVARTAQARFLTRFTESLVEMYRTRDFEQAA